MTTGFDLQFDALVDWIRETDAHANHHLALLDQVAAAGEDSPDIWSAERAALADKLERWRYQHLQQRAGQWSARDEQLADWLDVAAKQLAGSPFDQPRRTRQAVLDSAYDPPTAQEALDALDPQRSWEELSGRANQLTREHFSCRQEAAPGAGTQRRMLLYAPLYVSSECVNYCVYCGFRYPLTIARKHLNRHEAAEQLSILQQRGFEHVLIVGGDFPSRTTAEYYGDLVDLLVSEGVEPALEIAPQSTQAYAQLAARGVCGVTLYQETYDRQLYRQYHPRGPKSSYDWRLEGHDRAGEAGMARLGLGILLGLAEPRQDLLAMMRHARYLAERFPDRTLAFSLPRIHEAPDDFQVPYRVSDEQLSRLYCALRIAFPQAELVLSTREPRQLRHQLAAVCITQLSAGSSTQPGGYQPSAPPLGRQFPVADQRSPAQVAHWLQQQGMRICWSVRQARGLTA